MRLQSPLVGIIQGRLSPPPPDHPQRFPHASWREEFSRAQACGYGCIEWLVDEEPLAANPMMQHGFAATLHALSHATGVQVRTVCADYFMAHPMHGVDTLTRVQHAEALAGLVERAGALNIETVLVPVLERTTIRTSGEAAELADGLREPLQVAEQYGLRIGLECDLPVNGYLALLHEIDHPHVGAYYDLGNAVAMGYDIVRDLEALGPLLCGVHIKDRTRGGPSVPLGEGAVDLPAGLAAALATGFRGPLIVQGRWGDDYLALAQQYRVIVQRALEPVLTERACAS